MCTMLNLGLKTKFDFINCETILIVFSIISIWGINCATGEVPVGSSQLVILNSVYKLK